MIRVSKRVAAAGGLAMAGLASATVLTLGGAAQAHTEYVVHTRGGALTVRDAPSTEARAIGTVSNRQRVQIQCQIRGSMVRDGVYTDTDLWNRIGPGRYVSDAYVSTGSTGMVAPPCPTNHPKVGTGLASQNGWPVSTDSAAIGITKVRVPGSSAHLTVKSGDVATVLLYVATRFHNEVQPLDPPQSGGWNPRKVRGNSTTWSNHASGTAIDLNWADHPLGERGTFTSAQIAAIRDILADTQGVVRWGGDYTRRADEMHFEIVVRPDDPTLALVARNLR